MKIPQANVKVEYTRFEGGLDQESPAITFPPGALMSSKNYVSRASGGYQRIDGYERYDGRPSPSDATYQYYDVAFSDAISIGDTIAGVNSGATGIVANHDSLGMNLVKITGSFELEDVTVSSSIVGTITGISSGEASIYDDAVAKADAADIYRSDITKPAGSYPVRGICMLKGILYAFVDDSSGTIGEIYEATGTGWSKVDLHSEISFDSGTGLIEDGDSIVQDISGATAVVERVVKTSGAWGTDAAGKLIISNISGTFNSSDNLKVGGAVQATATSTTSSITISPGGRYEFVVYNFSADIDRSRIYGCDGTNRGFEFDGSVYVPIDVPLSSGASDTPSHIDAHKKQLFLYYESGVMHSGVGFPYEYTAIAGANFISLGDKITGSEVLPGEALAIFARNETAQLIGNNVDDYKLDSISNEMGAIPYTIQRMGQVLCLDDRGIILVSPSDVYGNFVQDTISRKIQTLINQTRDVVVASGVYRSKDQYRLYGSDGTGVCMTRIGDRFDFSFFEYPDNVSCVHCTEDEKGKDVVFFGTDEGWVMQADKGSSFDGQDIEAYFSLPFNNSKSPATLKTYRKATFEISSSSYTAINFITTLSYGQPYYPENTPTEKEILGSGGYWDVANWDEFSYDREALVSPSIKLSGVGTNMSITVYSKSNIDLGHKFDGIIIHYTPRRLSR